jgi:MFS family permease
MFGVESNFKVIAVRSVLVAASTGLSAQLGVLYLTKVLGADEAVFGYLAALQSAVLLASILFGGWLADNWGRKNAFLLGAGLQVLQPLVMAVMPSWEYVVMVYVIGALSSSMLQPARIAMYIPSMQKGSRATKISYVTLSTTIANTVIPPLGAYSVDLLGGLSQMRIIFLLQFLLQCIAWAYTTKLADRRSNHVESGRSVHDIWQEMKSTFKVAKENHGLGWVWISIVGPLAYSVCSPFWILFADNRYFPPIVVIGLLTTTYSLGSILTLVPVGRYSDRQGRIKAIKFLRPISFTAQALFLLGYRLEWQSVYLLLLVVWGLRGASSACSSPCQSASNEVVPERFLGRWTALNTFLSSLTSIPAGILGSLLWNMDPTLPFICGLIIDITMRYPVVYFKLPETLVKPEEGG